jgi:uncharacterized C2H2 Zn-finger protein
MATNNFYNCLFDSCEAKFANVKKLLFHMRVIHIFDKNIHLTCCIGKCEKLYSTVKSYKKHVEREHRMELENGECNVLHVENNFDVQYNAVDLPSNDGDVIDTCDGSNADLSNIFQVFSRNVTLFALRTRESHSLAKSISSNILCDVSTLFVTFFQQFSEFILTRLTASGIDISVDHSLNRLLLDNDVFTSVWTNIDTDSKLKRYCKEKLGLVESKRIFLGHNSVTGKEESYEYIPIVQTLQQYVQHEDVWNSINRNVIKTSDVLYDYTDGSAFKQHFLFSKHPEALRIHLYIDDVELCNPLGGAKKNIQYVLFTFK